jgi:hypothetical protein
MEVLDMLRIYDVALAMAGDVATVAVTIGRQDADLARQMRRAMQSVVLNLGEATENPPPNDGRRFSWYPRAECWGVDVRASSTNEVCPLAPDPLLPNTAASSRLDTESYRSITSIDGTSSQVAFA